MAVQTQQEPDRLGPSLQPLLLALEPQIHAAKILRNRAMDAVVRWNGRLFLFD